MVFKLKKIYIHRFNRKIYCQPCFRLEGSCQPFHRHFLFFYCGLLGSFSGQMGFFLAAVPCVASEKKTMCQSRIQFFLYNASIVHMLHQQSVVTSMWSLQTFLCAQTPVNTYLQPTGKDSHLLVVMRTLAWSVFTSTHCTRRY